MLEPAAHPYRAPFTGGFRVAEAPTAPPEDAPSKKDCKKLLEDTVEEIRELQRILYAHDRRAILLIFQAMDAAGKDGTIRAVLSGLNPAGCQVFSFKKPSDEELDHDFLWRSAIRLPERGRIGVFNRSYYEETLVVRVHPELLERQKLPLDCVNDQIWQERFESIRDHEKHLARNGVVMLKFWLNVSRDEQKDRFLKRIDEPEKNWKFSFQDVAERGHWDRYMECYEDVINATSRPWAPWYAIPADSKPYMRLTVAQILLETMRGMGLHYPQVAEEDRRRFLEMRTALEQD